MNCSIGKYGDVHMEGGQSTVIGIETTASFAYELYKEKKEQIRKLEYECEVLVDKYHAEMKRANIPFMFSQDNLVDMFSKDKKTGKFAREHFLEKCFSPDFPKRHKIEFVNYSRHGYHATAIDITLGIGDYEYTINFPQPQNILDEKDKEYLMGKVKFRVDKLHKSKTKDFVREMEPVQMPTYDWKKCLEAVEADVERLPAGQEAE